MQIFEKEEAKIFKDMSNIASKYMDLDGNILDGYSDKADGFRRMLREIENYFINHHIPYLIYRDIWTSANSYSFVYYIKKANKITETSWDALNIDDVEYHSVN